MKKLLCLAFAMLISISCFAYGESTVGIDSIPNAPTDVSLRLALDLTGVQEHEFKYDVTINFSEATFGYAYTGEYRTDPVTNDIDYSGITGSWTDNEAKLQITCNEASDIIKVYVKDDKTSYLMRADDYTHDRIVTITSDNTTTKDAPRTLNPSESLDVTYTAEGTIPIDAYFQGSTGGLTQTAANYIGQTKSFNILSFQVYITDEFGAGTENWV